MDFHNGFRVAQQKGPNYLGGQLDGAARTAIHVSHRLGALLVSLCVLLLAWRLWAAGLGRLAWLLLVALVGQLALGIGNVLLHLPLHLALAHNAGGALLLLVVVLVHYRLRRPAGVLLVRPLPARFESVREGALP
jgi:cytochrome c oxidase assembly protein subunit 15